jgi:hypothetical protein
VGPGENLLAIARFFGRGDQPNERLRGGILDTNCHSRMGKHGEGDTSILLSGLADHLSSDQNIWCNRLLWLAKSFGLP